MKLELYSLGMGDRFGHQGVAQLKAIQKACAQGVELVPVWNKSHREHTIIGTSPADTRRAADQAVKQAGWTASYYLDADHISRKNVEGFIPHCDFFTLDVAESIGQPASEPSVAQFVERNRQWVGEWKTPGMPKSTLVTEDSLLQMGRKYAAAIEECGRLYRLVASRKAKDGFVVEVSMDEADIPQSPAELFFILGGLAHETVPVQTIAPRFSGRFNKGVDYVGKPEIFGWEFDAYILSIRQAIQCFDLPKHLKLSVHSGSDKFSLYPIIHAALKRHGVGIHVKTAGTTWLEEVAGLAAAGKEGLALAREIYRKAYDRRAEMTAPYASVIDIRPDHLPKPDEVDQWNSTRFVEAVRHIPSCKGYNPDMRQLLHVGYKVAAEMGTTYIQALERFADVIGPGVTENLFDRHIRPIFLG